MLSEQDGIDNTHADKDIRKRFVTPVAL